MAADKHHRKKVVSEFRCSAIVKPFHLLECENPQLRRNLRLMIIPPGAPAKTIYREILCRCHEPSARVVRHTAQRPGLECFQECFLGDILGQCKILDTQETCQAGHYLSSLTAKQVIDESMHRLGGRFRHSNCLRIYLADLDRSLAIKYRTGLGELNSFAVAIGLDREVAPHGLLVIP
jgi:hypothetical protein